MPFKLNNRCNKINKVIDLIKNMNNYITLTTFPNKRLGSFFGVYFTLEEKMRHLLSSLVFVFIFIASPIYAGQEVSGLEINYSPSFKKDTATADSLLSKVSDNNRQVVISMDIFVAPPSNGLGEVRLVKVRYVPTLNGSIDGAAAESAQRIAELEGIKNFQKQIAQLSVSGFDARQVSIAADRWGGKLGGEFLIIYNRKSNVMWQMQLIFGKKKGINPFASLSIDEERRYAKNLLSTIKIAP